MIRTAPATTDDVTAEPAEVALLVQDLARQEVATKTLVNYRSDLRCFARWFAGVNDEPCTAAAVTPTDVRDYRAFLVQEERRKPATVNRRLAALRKFFTWAKATGRVQDLPTDAVKGVEASPRAPKALAKRELDRLIRAVEKEGKKRDLAIVLTLRHTGLRVSELCALRLGDVELGERKGSVTVRAGKGSKYRVVPLNLDARKAIQDYLAVRPAVVDDRLFIGQRHQGLSTQAVENLVAKYARLAGLSDVTPMRCAIASAKDCWMPAWTSSPWPPSWAIAGWKPLPSTPTRAPATWHTPWRGWSVTPCRLDTPPPSAPRTPP